MSKFDKKVLKFVTARQEDDLDLDDIAIGLHLDEDDVHEALDSLQEQGKIEGSSRNGKTYWRLAAPEMEPEEVPKSVPEKTGAEETEQFSIRSEPDEVAIGLDQAIEKPAPVLKPEPAPVAWKVEPVEIEKNFEPPTPMFSTPEESGSEIDNADDDTDFNQQPRLFDSPVVRIAIAVVLSVVISAIISMMVAGGSSKGHADAIQALERTSTETSARLDKRIMELSAQLNVLDQKVSNRQGPKVEQNRSVAAAAASKASHASHKKRTSKHAQSDESTTSSSEPSTSPASDQSTPSSSSGQSDNPAPAPESTPPSSTEGTGGSGQ
jgi:hypothetical protein